MWVCVLLTCLSMRTSVLNYYVKTQIAIGLTKRHTTFPATKGFSKIAKFLTRMRVRAHRLIDLCPCTFDSSIHFEEFSIYRSIAMKSFSGDADDQRWTATKNSRSTGCIERYISLKFGVGCWANHFTGGHSREINVYTSFARMLWPWIIHLLIGIIYGGQSSKVWGLYLQRSYTATSS